MTTYDELQTTHGYAATMLRHGHHLLVTYYTYRTAKEEGYTAAVYAAPAGTDPREAPLTLISESPTLHPDEGHALAWALTHLEEA